MVIQMVRPLAWWTTALAFVAVAVALIADRPASVLASPPAIPSVKAPDRSAESDNPRVAPGLVHWHPSQSEAQAACERSGKPVLLFHMMGQLDRQFC